MGFRERLKETAQQAQEGLAKGQAKLEQFQNRQSVNDQLQALGQAYWVQQAGRATPEQLQTLLEGVRPAIEDGESRLGPMTWPAVPSDATPTGGTSTGPPSSVPPSTSTASAPDLGPEASGWAAPTPPPPTPTAPTAPTPSAPSSMPAAPSSMPTAIHHEPAPPEG